MSHRLIFQRIGSVVASASALTLLSVNSQASGDEASYGRALSRLSSQPSSHTSSTIVAAIPQKVISPADAMSRWPRLYVIPQTRAVAGLFTTLRDIDSAQGAFVNAADRLMRILAEEGLAALPGSKEIVVQTPVGNYSGFRVAAPHNVSAVSIVRAGDSLLEAAHAVCPSLSSGKILIQRDEEDAEKRPKLFYVKLPNQIATRAGVLLVDPMLATGQSAGLAIRELLSRGVLEENIVFLNVVACPEGLDALFAAHPKIKVVTGAVDSHLNSSKYIVPGLGDFGDRYFGTTQH